MIQLPLDIESNGAKPPTGSKKDTKMGPPNWGAQPCLAAVLKDAGCHQFRASQANRRTICLLCLSISGCSRCAEALKPMYDLGSLYHGKKRKKVHKGA